MKRLSAMAAAIIVFSAPILFPLVSASTASAQERRDRDQVRDEDGASGRGERARERRDFRAGRMLDDEEEGGRGPGAEFGLRFGRLLREHGGGGGPGARFVLRRGDAFMAVRCDPRESMRSCIDATAALLEQARALASPSRDR
jgi:hypothetical protein